MYFRVGRSNRAGLVFFPVAGWENAYVPDIDKFAEVVRHIVLHYNKGWADGYHYGIRYWEIWNEPDFKPFWNGTPDAVPRAVREDCPGHPLGRRPRQDRRTGEHDAQ